MMYFKKYAKLITLNQTYIDWEKLVPGWRIRTFIEYCEFLKFTGWRVI